MKSKFSSAEAINLCTSTAFGLGSGGDFIFGTH